MYRCMLNSTIRFSFFLYFCVFVCVCFMFVLFSLSIFFLLCSMGQVDGNKTDDEWNLRRGAHLLSQAIEPVGGYTTESVTHGQ